MERRTLCVLTWHLTAVLHQWLLNKNRTLYALFSNIFLKHIFVCCVWLVAVLNLNHKFFIVLALHQSVSCRFDVGSEVFVFEKSGSARSLGLAFVSLLPAVVSRTYEAYGIWLQIGKKWNVFCLKIFSCKRSVWKFVIVDVFLKTSQSETYSPVQTFKKPWNCLKSAVLTFHVVTRCWQQIKGLFPFHIASGQTTKHWRHCLFVIYFSNQLIFSMTKGA